MSKLVSAAVCNFQVRLIASVPGYHTGNNMKKWGHMKLRTVLQECTFDKEFRKSPLAYQVRWHNCLTLLLAVMMMDVNAECFSLISCSN